MFPSLFGFARNLKTKLLISSAEVLVTENVLGIFDLGIVTY